MCDRYPFFISHHQCKVTLENVSTCEQDVHSRVLLTPVGIFSTTYAYRVDQINPEFVQFSFRQMPGASGDKVLTSVRGDGTRPSSHCKK